MHKTTKKTTFTLRDLKRETDLRHVIGGGKVIGVTKWPDTPPPPPDTVG